ncbi:ribosomal maturation YjgA family protein [Mucilaginibacter arboris]|uniref:DUF2809 domain-containing protein n=1 Tax=Mucilaginibacter arboris TaxID=2682090 RepID=A0A7K1SZT2_9SPHI|nr:DUF2809 domain-containing protein [Mucilaginibacter arboris]MVN22821.1 DUF2809 domain-containing protein [Mucilaginibacter arboris]
MNKTLFQFHKKYFFLALLLFVTEVLIAVYLHDAIIRPYGGDFLVVILIYCFVKSFLNTPVKATALAVLLFSYLIETLQYFHIVDILGLEKSTIARIVIGTSFSWTDLLAYTLGILLVLIIEFTSANANNKRQYLL